MNSFKNIALLALFLAASVQLSAQSNKLTQRGIGDQIHQEARIAGSCDDITDAKELEKCSTNALAKALYSNLNYPAAARESGIQGTVIVGFSVEKDGRLSDPHVKKDIGGGCGNACIDALIKMNAKFTPATNSKGEAIISYVEMPVKFKVE